MKSNRLSKECVGISSQVVTMMETNLHVLFYDIEGQMFHDVKEIAQRHENYFIFQSSPFNFHIIVPQAMPKSKVIYHKENAEIDDNQHLKVGSNRDSWVLRISGKGEKDEPDLLEYKFEPRTPETTFSKPHLQWINEIFEDVNIEIPQRKCIGTALRCEKYWTY